MKFCTGCGYRLDDDQAFCTECGMKQGNHDGESNASPEQVTSTLSKKPMSRRAKVVWISTGSLIGLMIIAHFIITSIINPVKSIQMMDRAMTEGDANSFFEDVTLDESALIHKEEFMRFIDEAGWEEVREQMTQVIEDKDASDFDRKIYDSYGNDLFVMKKVAVMPGLYHTYEIESVPNQLLLSTNVSPSSFTIEKENLEVRKTKDHHKFLKLYPGTYELKGEASNEFGEFTISQEVVVDTTGAGDFSITAAFPEETFTIFTNHPEATLFVNGKSTKKKLSEFKTIGPFPDDKEVKLHAEWKNKDGDMLKTEPVTQNSAFWGELNFVFEDAYEENNDPPEEEEVALNEDFDEEAEMLVLDFRAAYESALNATDFSVISPYLLSGSKAEEELKEYIEGLVNNEFTYEFVDNEILSVESTSGNGVVVKTKETFVFTNDEGAQTHYDRKKDYYLQEVSDELKINRIDINETKRSDL
ncbi:TcaA NTF2-like domain-containing protein [Halobacillus mangrovi]|uniref:TcaA NTF2-like domain-containing protein n=1 Tax=Halobacillus mangrovi TaxID=402384 RepID=UPI003D95AF28